MFVRVGGFRMRWAFCCLLVVGFFAATSNAASAADSHIRDMVNDPWFWDVTAASGLGWFMGTLKGFSGSKEWLARYDIKAPKWLVLIVDCIVYVGVGGFVGIAIYNPQTLHAAMAAGVSWPLGLGALTTK
jgi:hypothetical protein